MIEKNISKLIDACCEAVENPDYQPKMDTTFCNYAVNFIALRMGYGKLKMLMANQIVDLLLIQDEWLEIAPDAAQYHANQGALVLAAQKGDLHGHVCVVRPGELTTSGKWNSNKVPKVANVGKNNFLSKGANYAFSTEPQYFVLKEMV